MAYKIGSKIDVFLIRIMYEFYPTIGGSIVHTLEEIKEINPYVAGQVIIAPDFQMDCSDFDDKSEISVLRVRSPLTPKWISDRKIPIHPLILLFFALHTVKRIRTIESERAENIIVHVEGGLLGAILSLILKLQRSKIPIVITQHSANPFRISYREKIASWFSLPLLALGRPAWFLVLDDGMGIEEFGRIIDRIGIKWNPIYHAFNDDFFIPSDVTHQDGFIILSTSRLDPFKRMDLALRAYSRFLKISGAVDGRFIIAGSGEELQSLKKLAKDMRIEDSVDFVGEKSIDEIRELLKKASVVIGTSVKSNVNRSTQEAMCAGKAVIVFNNGAEKKLITDGYDGILVKSGDLNAFAEALKIIHDDSERRRTLGMNAKEKMLRERSWKKRINDNLDTYEEISRNRANR